MIECSESKINIHYQTEKLQEIIVCNAQYSVQR